VKIVLYSIWYHHTYSWPSRPLPLYVYRVNPHVSTLTTPPPSPHYRVQNKHVKIFHRFRVLYLCTFQRVLKPHSNSRRLDWNRLGRCEHPLTGRLDSVGVYAPLCWCRCTLRVNIPVRGIGNWVGPRYLLEVLKKMNLLLIPAIKKITCLSVRGCHYIDWATPTTLTFKTFWTGTWKMVCSQTQLCHMMCI